MIDTRTDFVFTADGADAPHDGGRTFAPHDGGRTFASPAEAALHRSAAEAEGTGEMIFTDADIRRRLTSSTGIREEIVAHYQHSVSAARTELEERVIEVYYVENIDKGNGYEVVLSHTEDGQRTATCECIGYVEHGSLCKHIVRAVQMGRRRITRRRKTDIILLPAAAAEAA